MLALFWPKNSPYAFAMSYAISLSPVMLFDGGGALCYLDCCSICIKTIIICMYLIRIVISFIWVTAIFTLLWFNLLNKKSNSYPAQWQKHVLRLSDTETAHYEIKKAGKMNYSLTCKSKLRASSGLFYVDKIRHSGTAWNKAQTPAEVVLVLIQ